MGQSDNENPREVLTDAEEPWAQLIEDSDDLAVAADSVGFNQPEPKAGPLK